MAVRTYAPRGQTPVLRLPLTRDHLAAISGITPDGRLFMHMQDHAYRSEDVVRFLRLLLRKIAGNLLVIWDGAPIHRGQEIKAFLARGAAKRLHLEQLPGYAPELNPDEGIWNLREAELNSRMCAATICSSWQRRYVRPKSGSDTSERLSAVASVNVAGPWKSIPREPIPLVACSVTEASLCVGEKGSGRWKSP